MTLADRIDDVLVAELTTTISDDRDDVDSEDLAAALLGWEGGNRSLLGLTHDCHRAVYVDETVSLVHSFPIPEGELRSQEQIEHWTTEDRPATYAFVRERGREGWDWVHPRYRWVFDVELPSEEDAATG